MAQLVTLARKWFPGRQPDGECLAEALHLETDYWERMKLAVANGIAMAFKG